MGRAIIRNEWIRFAGVQTFSNKVFVLGWAWGTWWRVGINHCLEMTLKSLEGGWWKYMWKENGWELVFGPVSSLNFPKGSVKVDLLNWFYFTGFSILQLVRGMNRVSNLHPGVLISGSTSWSHPCNCPLGKKGYPVYDSAEFYVHKCKDLIVGFDGF